MLDVLHSDLAQDVKANVHAQSLLNAMMGSVVGANVTARLFTSTNVPTTPPRLWCLPMRSSRLLIPAEFHELSLLAMEPS